MIPAGRPRRMQQRAKCSHSTQQQLVGARGGGRGGKMAKAGEGSRLRKLSAEPKQRDDAKAQRARAARGAERRGRHGAMSFAHTPRVACSAKR